MKRVLTTAEIEYVWMHFEHHYKISEDIKKLIVYFREQNDDGSPSQQSSEGKPMIGFPLSDKDVANQPFFDSQKTLVLFPKSKDKQPYQIKNGTLVFHHDYLKSVFYFLSGYQEWSSQELDPYGRFPYTGSLQYKYHLPLLPYVNEIMDILAEGLSTFCNANGLSFSKKPLWDKGVFLLSHDIDHIRQYRLSYFKYKIKELAGLVKNKKYTKSELASQFLHAIRSRITGKQDPACSFDFLQKINEEYETRATYFFLTKESPRDASYDLHSVSVRKLISRIEKWGNEIAVHGTMASSEKINSARKNLQKTRDVSLGDIQGIRQHWLKYKLPATTRIHEAMGYLYDATLGFHDRSGFRHGYCFPFKLWDFDHQKPFDIWEIPLCAMDVSMLSYMNLSLDQCEVEIETWAEEVRKRTGVFSLLWHNSSLNENEIPGIRDKYRKLVGLLSSNLDVKTHAEVADQMNKRTSNR